MGNATKVTYGWFRIQDRLVKPYILEGDIKYPKELPKLHNGVSFLSARVKIYKCKRIVCNLCETKTIS